jgi:osmotically-inducible protein OsmY
MTTSATIDAATTEILVIGTPPRRERLQPALQELAPMMRGVDTCENAMARIGPTTAAIIVDAASVGLRDVTRLRRALGMRDVPIVLIVDAGSSSGRAVAGYDAGATAVLEWPTEALLAHDLLRELLELPDGERPRAAGDVALAEGISARLRLDEALPDTLRCSVVRGTAVLRGELESLWERDRLSRLVGAVPGITRVVDHGVAIRPSDVPDTELEETVAGVLLSAGNVEARNLAASVDSGVVTLTGHADAETVTRVRNALRSVPGVRRVFDVTGEDSPPFCKGDLTADFMPAPGR